MNDLESSVRCSDDQDEHLVESWWIRRKIYSIDIAINGTLSCRGLTDNSLLSSSSRSIDKLGCSISIEDILDTCGLFGSNSVLLMTNESIVSMNESSSTSTIQRLNYFQFAQKILHTVHSASNEFLNMLLADRNISNPNMTPSSHNTTTGRFSSFSREIWHPKSSSMDSIENVQDII